MGLSCPHCTKTIDGWVPEERLSKASQDKREALAKIEEHVKQIEALNATAATAETLKAELEAAKAELTKTTTAHTRQVDVMRHGITDADDVADLLAIYERRANGSTVGEWLTDRDNLPRSVSALLNNTNTPTPPSPSATPVAPPVETAPTPAPSNGAPAPNGAAPSANAGAVPVPPGGTALPTPSEIGSMTTEQYRAHRDRLLASLTS